MPAIDVHPAVAVRDDGVAMVAYEDRGPRPTGSQIVLFIDTPQGPVVSFDWHYEYDDLGRMTSACANWLNGECIGDEWQYRQDGAGNLLRFDRWEASEGRTVTAQYVVNGANQIECIDDLSGDGDCEDGEFKWKYDPYGNLLDNSVTQYTYDAAGRLSTVTVGAETNNSVTTTYTYNGDGQRVSQSDNSNILFPPVTIYTLDVATSTMLAETTGGTTVHYLNGLTAIAQSDGATTSYFQYDGTGSARQMTNPDGSVQYSQTFDPYGNLYNATDENGATIGFGGGIHDSNGLVYSSGKYYAPTQGQFLQQNLDYMDRFFRPQLDAFSSKVDLRKTQQFFSSLPSTAGKALPSFGVTVLKEVVVEPPLWVDSMVRRQDHIMNYDTYYAPYGEAGKYLRVQDMMKQTEDIANATFATFDAITWWNGIGTESAIYRQALGRLGLSADEVVLLGKNADEVVRLAQWQQQAQWAGAEDMAWQFEDLRIIEDVRYSAARSGRKEVVVRLDEVVDQNRASYEYYRYEYNHRGVYFANNPDLRPFAEQIHVHHRVPLETMLKYPGEFMGKELSLADNLEGIPVPVNNLVHESALKRVWNQFYRDNPVATRQDVLGFAEKTDIRFDLRNLARKWFLGSSNGD